MADLHMIIPSAVNSTSQICSSLWGDSGNRHAQVKPSVHRNDCCFKAYNVFIWHRHSKVSPYLQTYTCAHHPQPTNIFFPYSYLSTTNKTEHKILHPHAWNSQPLKIFFIKIRERFVCSNCTLITPPYIIRFGPSFLLVPNFHYMSTF